jgi:IS5 family transposase
LKRNWLKGALGDAMHALLCGAGHNLRMILAHLRVLYCALVGQIAMAVMLITGATSPQQASSRT